MDKTGMSLNELLDKVNAPRAGAGAITASMARQARDRLNLDASTMARMMGVSRASVFHWESKGVLSGPACVIYDLILHGDLPERFIPTEDTKGRVLPTAD